MAADVFIKKKIPSCGAFDTSHDGIGISAVVLRAGLEPARRNARGF